MIRFKKNFKTILLIILNLSLIFMVFFMIFNKRRYKPPVFDPATIKGVYQPSEEENYIDVPQETGEKIKLLCNPVYDENKKDLKVFISNLEENKSWILCEIRDDSDERIGSSGIIKNGFWLEKITLESTPNNPVNLKILRFEPETYHNAGKTITLKLPIKNKG